MQYEMQMNLTVVALVAAVVLTQASALHRLFSLLGTVCLRRVRQIDPVLCRVVLYLSLPCSAYSIRVVFALQLKRFYASSGLSPQWN